MSDMNISAEQLLELIVAAAEGAKAAPYADQRKAPRVGMKCPVRWRAVVDASGTTGPSQAGTIRDISAGGVGLIVDQEITEGSAFVVELPRLGGAVLEMLCLCCYVQPCNDGRYQVGAEFFAEWGSCAHSPTKESSCFEAVHQQVA